MSKITALVTELRSMWRVNNGSVIVRHSVRSVFIDSGGGDDEVIVDGNIVADLYGGEGDDFIVDGRSHDIIFGGAGNDVIWGRDSDYLDGGEGNDKLCGDAGDDAIYGRQGSDFIKSGNGNDFLAAANGDCNHRRPFSLADGNIGEFSTEIGCVLSDSDGFADQLDGGDDVDRAALDPAEGDTTLDVEDVEVPPAWVSSPLYWLRSTSDETLGAY